MNKEMYVNLKAYKYDSEHKRSHYTFDGIHYMNGGEFAEAQYKFCLGLTAEKDANTPFDAGSDIEELHMSVKSSKAALTSMKLGKDFEDYLDCYFQRTASTAWAWVVIIDDVLTAYIMNKTEFEEFTRTFSIWEKDRIRYKATSGKMIKWFEERV